MPPTRRAALGMVGTSALAALAGCAGIRGAAGGGGSNGTPTIGTADGVAFEVRLLGPGTDRFLYDQTDVAEVGAVQDGNGRSLLPLTLTDAGAADVTAVFRTVGVVEDPGSYEIVHFHRDEEVLRLSITPNLAEAVASGEWEGEVVLTFAEREQARELRASLVGSSGPRRTEGSGTDTPVR